MEQLRRGGFVLSDDLDVIAVEGHLTLQGRIYCKGGIQIDVNKRLRLDTEDGHDTVQTVAYGYNVSLQNLGNIFRYDSPHPTHNREHHVHRYDVLSGDTNGTVEIDYREDGWPTLRQVVDEAAEWYYAHLPELIEAGLENWLK